MRSNLPAPWCLAAVVVLVGCDASGPEAEPSTGDDGAATPVRSWESDPGRTPADDPPLDDERPVDDDTPRVDDVPPVEDDTPPVRDEPPVEDDTPPIDDEPPVEDDTPRVDDEPDPCAEGVWPVAAPARLLTRAELDRTARDLLGVEGTPFGDGLPPENVVHGFENQAGAHIASPLWLEQLLLVVEAVALARWQDAWPCAELVVSDGCRDALVDGFGERAFRRPLTGEERALLVEAFDAGVEAGGLEEGNTHSHDDVPFLLAGGRGGSAAVATSSTRARPTTTCSRGSWG